MEVVGGVFFGTLFARNLPNPNKNKLKPSIICKKVISGLQQRTFSPSSKNSCIQIMRFSCVK
jgi:hypothetical protein